MQYQTTIAKNATYTGIGLHSGCEVTVTIKPAPANTGIVFVRVDLPGCPQVAAISDNVTATMRATTLENGEAKVFTVEHLLAACNAMQLDNCYIEMNAPEPPVADGSAIVFVDLIKETGIVEQEVKRQVLVIDQVYTVRDNDKFITIIPYDGFRVSFTSVNPHPMLGVQYCDIELNPENFRKEIAPARTIAFTKEIEALQKMGLGLGGSIENVIVYDEVKALNPLRYEDELVRHKVLDVVGDMRLAGNIRGHIIAVKSSHALNTALARKIKGFVE